MRLLTFTVTDKENNLSVLDFLRLKGFSRRIVTKLKLSGAITKDGKALRSVDAVHSGDVLEIRISDEKEEHFPEPNSEINATVAYEDEDAVVFDKGPFVPIHPSIAHYTDTLANYYSALYPKSVFRPINRLDRNTSGLCLCGKNRLATALLSENVQKTYYAIVDGIIADEGEINLPIGRVDDSIIKREVRSDGQPAVTLYKPVLWNKGRTLLEVTLKTGRTHQIRVHFSHIGYPLCGDDMYGGSCEAIDRHALHCGKLCFVKPFTGEEIVITSELPEDMKKLIE